MQRNEKGLMNIFIAKEIIVDVYTNIEKMEPTEFAVSRSIAEP